MNRSFPEIDDNPRYDFDNEEDEDELFEDALEETENQRELAAQQGADDDDDDEEEDEDEEEEDDDDDEEEEEEEDDDDDEDEDDDDDNEAAPEKRPSAGYKTKPRAETLADEESDEDEDLRSPMPKGTVAGKGVARRQAGDKKLPGATAAAVTAASQKRDEPPEFSRPPSKSPRVAGDGDSRSIARDAGDEDDDEDDEDKDDDQEPGDTTTAADTDMADALPDKEPFVDVEPSEAEEGTGAEAAEEKEPGLLTFRQRYPIECDPAAKAAASYDIIPYTAALHACPVYCVDVSWGLKWMFTGGQDGFIRRFNFFDSINNKLPLTVAQRHPFVDSITRVSLSFDLSVIELTI